MGKYEVCSAVGNVQSSHDTVDSAKTALRKFANNTGSGNSYVRHNFVKVASVKLNRAMRFQVVSH